GEIRPRAEALPRSRQHDTAHAFQLISFIQFFKESVGEIRIERVALLRAIHGQDANGISILDHQNRDSPHLFVSHREATLRRASSAWAPSGRLCPAAGRTSSTMPALCPASTLPHSTSPCSAAALRLEVLKISSSSEEEAPARSAASYLAEKAFFSCRIW